MRRPTGRRRPVRARRPWPARTPGADARRAARMPQAQRLAPRGQLRGRGGQTDADAGTTAAAETATATVHRPPPTATATATRSAAISSSTPAAECSVTTTAPFTPTPSVAQARDVLYNPRLVRACGYEMHEPRFCGGVEHGGGAVLACLEERRTRAGFSFKCAAAQATCRECRAVPLPRWCHSRLPGTPGTRAPGPRLLCSAHSDGGAVVDRATPGLAQGTTRQPAPESPSLAPALHRLGLAPDGG